MPRNVHLQIVKELEEKCEMLFLKNKELEVRLTELQEYIDALYEHMQYVEAKIVTSKQLAHEIATFLHNDIRLMKHLYYGNIHDLQEGETNNE